MGFANAIPTSDSEVNQVLTDKATPQVVLLKSSLATSDYKSDFLPEYITTRKHPNQMLNDWCDLMFTGNIWPKHWSQQQKDAAEKKSRTMPEEFYTYLKLPVVIPDNVEQFLACHKVLNIDWQFQEQFSGSGRLSKTSYRQQLSTLFPVDSRYGGI